MIVVTLTDCPPALRGDLSKWLLEINTGVYVGDVSARVRDKLWERITANIKTGRATMVFDAANEQKLDFYIHNSSWEIVDCDGIKLVRRPSEQRIQERMKETGEALPSGFSKAAKQQMLKRIANKKTSSGALRKGCPMNFTVVDIETTGLNVEEDAIIEIAAMRVRNLEPEETFSALIRTDHPLPEAAMKLTGLSSEQLLEQGLPLREGLMRLVAFVGDDTLVIHNAPFDVAFLRESLAREHLPPLQNRSLDTCMLARKAFLKVPNYKLSTLAEHFGVGQPVSHRALPDCQTVLGVYCGIAQTE
ncbi:MAG: type I-E CRISPR-associated endoribonuclease Cas2e [bacterium]